MFIHTLATLLALSATTQAVAFNGPEPTRTSSTGNTNGWTPKPTSLAPPFLSLFARKSDQNALCGYVEGLAKYPLSCATGSCRQNTSLNWFGCCADADDASCNNSIVTRCVASASVDACVADAACYENPRVMACADSSAPFCVQMRTVVGGQATLSHFVCAAKETMVLVKGKAVATGEGSGSSAMTAAATGSGKGDDGGASAAGVRSTMGAQSGNGGVNVAATTSVATAGAAVQTAKGLVGAVGGVVGAVAMLL
ncbi:hypothetical protein T440DRAFT_291503 [Plenodomus tracheiphilus IPT5]|uniref:Extracellular membrane protein CFEM domain-containing protein n=1 Tax=Plenodomus tracheiphilus IPT5 TaxID=1408161 RepID=A0A6A7BGL6_9PLEO|nr:hypothetical protein T440DRAFT_291503 [Plenodomus tracheiphilus IPT5]